MAHWKEGVVVVVVEEGNFACMLEVLHGLMVPEVSPMGEGVEGIGMDKDVVEVVVRLKMMSLTAACGLYNLHDMIGLMFSQSGLFAVFGHLKKTQESFGLFLQVSLAKSLQCQLVKSLWSLFFSVVHQKALQICLQNILA